jgi:DNA gyrase subunit B
MKDFLMTENADVVSDIVAPLAGAAEDAGASPLAAGYDADSITVLKGLEAVRKRPGMYIGDTSNGDGLHHMIYEVVDNGIDEALGGYADKVTLTINEDGSATVTDNGRGIPVDMHKKENRPAIEVIMTDLHAGGKFDQNSYKVSGGLHGVGVSVVNALSSRLEVTVFRNDQEYFIAFEHGFVVEPLRIVGPSEAGYTGTKVRFWPSPKTFDTVTFESSVLIKRMRELSFLNSLVTIVFQDLRVENSEPLVLFEENGIEGMVKYIDRKETAIHARPIICRGTKEVPQGDKKVEIGIDIAFQWNTGYRENPFSFTNNIPQKDGGTHVQGFRTSLTRVFTAFAEQNLTGKNKIAISAEDIREGMTAVVSVKVPDPKFSSQTKEKLVSSEVSGAVQQLVNEILPIWLDENPQEAKKILAKISEAAIVRAKTRAARESARKQSSLDIASLPDKLADCQSKKPEEAEVFIVEGDSAGGSAKQGRDRRIQAILPLRGKILNVERARMDVLLESEQIGTLINALGTSIGEEYFDADKCRYHKIIIMTDADVDGNHIRTLLLTFFYRYMPQLIERGYIYMAQPPLFKVTRGKTKTFLLDQPALDQYLLSNGLKNASLELADGTKYEEDALITLSLAARKQSEHINSLADDIGSEEVASTMAIAGFFAPAAFESLENRQALVEYLCELLTHRTERTIWSGEALETGIELTSRHRGVTNTFVIPSTVVRKQDAIALTREAEALGTIYGAGSTFIDRNGKSIFVNSPGQFFRLADGAGRTKDITVGRYKGLGEMNPDELKETTLDPENRSLLQVRLRDAAEADDIFKTLMGEEVEERRQYIIENSKLAEVDL